MQKLATAILLTPLLAACQTPIEVGVPAPPAERLQCAALPDAPSGLVPLQDETLGEGVRYYRKSDVDRRDAATARWIVETRDAWFSCANNLQWLREYYENQE